MSASLEGKEEKHQLDDLLERVNDLRLFDRTFEVNTYCDDLTSQVLLSVESAVRHLFKIQDELVEEVDNYRAGLLRGEKALEPNPDKVKMIEKLKQELEMLSEDIKKGNFSRPLTASSSDQRVLEHHKDRVVEICHTTLDWLKKTLRDLRWRMRMWAFNESFLRFRAKNFATQDKSLVGEFFTTEKDTERVIEIRHLILDDYAPKASSFQVVPFNFREPRLLDDIVALLFLQDGNLAISIYSFPIHVWSITSHSKLYELADEQRLDSAASMAQLPSGLLVSATFHGNVHLWDLNTRQKVKSFKGMDSPITGLRVLANSNLVGLGEEICIWNPFETDNQAVRLKLERAASFLDRASIEILDNGHLVGSFVDQASTTVRVWDPVDGRLVKERKIDEEHIEQCSVLANGDIVVWYSYNVLKIFNLANENICRTIEHEHGNVLRVKLLEDQSLLVVHLKDPKVPKLMRKSNWMFGGFSSFSAAVFSPDEKYLATGCFLRTLVLWPLSD